jgi:hypothetical protein
MTYTQKNVEPVLCPVHILKALASPCLSNRATLKAPRDVYTIIPSLLMDIIFYTPKGRSRCFGLDKQFEFARFSECQTQSVQKTPFVCMRYPLWKPAAKIVISFENTK